MSSREATGYLLLFLTRTHCAVLFPCYVQAGKGFLYKTDTPTFLFRSEGLMLWLREGRFAFWAKLAYAARYNSVYLYSYFPYSLSSKAPCPCFLYQIKTITSVSYFRVDTSHFMCNISFNFNHS